MLLRTNIQYRLKPPIHEQNTELLEHLLNIINDNRCDLLQKVVDQRTRFITVVLENIYQPQNASAVMRTTECMGIQDLHVIENDNEYRINPDVVQGASKWITLKRYNEKKMTTLSTVCSN